MKAKPPEDNCTMCLQHNWELVHIQGMIDGLRYTFACQTMDDDGNKCEGKEHYEEEL